MKGFFAEYRENGYGGSLVSPAELRDVRVTLEKLSPVRVEGEAEAEDDDRRRVTRLTWAGLSHLGWEQLPELWSLCLESESSSLSQEDGIALFPGWNP